MKELIMGIAVFTALQFINVILQTLKNVIMIKFESPHINVAANAIAYGFYAAVVKSMGGYDYLTVVMVTLITNIVGVYISYKIMAMTKRDNLWIIEVYTGNYSEELENGLKITVLGKEESIGFTKINYNLYRVYCYNQDQSRQVREIIKKYGMKYNVTEITKKL